MKLDPGWRSACVARSNWLASYRPAAGQRQHPPSGRVERDQRPLHDRHLAQQQVLRPPRLAAGAGRRGHDLGHHHVARMHHVLDAARRRALAAALAHRARPAQVGHGERQQPRRGGAVRRPLQQAELCHAARGLGDDGELPFRQHPGRARHAGQRLLPHRAHRGAGGEVRHRPAPAATRLVVAHQPVAQRAVGLRLQSGIEAGAHHEAALQGAVGAEAVHQLAAHLLGEEIRPGQQLGLRMHRRHHGLRVRPGRVLGRQHVRVEHAVQHPVAPRAGGVGVALRVVVVGRLRQRREERRLGRGQRVERLVEVGLRRRRHAVGALAEIDLVQVQLEDALLAQRPLDPDRQQRLLDLAREADLVGQQHVLDHLLGDGRCADRPLALAALHQVGRGGAQDGQRVDAVVAEEALVLGGDEGVLDEVRDRPVRHEDAPLGGEFRQ